MLWANRMIDASNATLNQRPETLNAVDVDIATNIDPSMMFNPFVVISKPSHVVIAREFISVEHGITVNGASHKGNKGRAFDVLYDFSCHFTMPLCSPNNFCRYVCSGTAHSRFGKLCLGLRYESRRYRKSSG